MVVVHFCVPMIITFGSSENSRKVLKNKSYYRNWFMELHMKIHIKVRLGSNLHCSNLHCSIINGFTFHLFLIDYQLKYEGLTQDLHIKGSAIIIIVLTYK